MVIVGYCMLSGWLTDMLFASEVVDYLIVVWLATGYALPSMIMN